MATGSSSAYPNLMERSPRPRWLLLSLLTVLASVLLNPVHASSLAQLRPLSHISPVSNIRIDTADNRIDHNSQFSLTVEIPAASHLHHLRRRWWAISDPNALPKANVLPGLQSENLYSYLTRNDTIEVPEDVIQFKLVLEPNDVFTEHPLKITTTDADGNKVDHPDFISQHDGDHHHRSNVFRGTAYRRMTVTSPATGDVAYQYRPVGWARIVVHRDGSDPSIEGAWKVDDEQGLGVPSSIYHINKVSTVHSTLGKHFPEERNLLSSIKTPLVVWRDFDMRHTSTFTSAVADLADTDFSFLLGDRNIGSGLSSAAQAEYVNGLGAVSDLVRRAMAAQDSTTSNDSSSSDTGNSGFSSGSNLATTVGNTTGCSTVREISLIGIAADCNFMKNFNSTQDATSYIISIVNTASQAYEVAFNVTLGLSEVFLVNQTEGCPSEQDALNNADTWSYNCSAGDDSITTRLSRFSQWRGNRSDDGLATWSMLTDCSQQSVVGLSWLGMLCRGETSDNGNDTFVAGTNVISHTSLDWRVLAHEIGHSFGAVHDCESDTCAQDLEASSGCCPLSQNTCNANGQFIMNPVSTESQDSFSQCTVGNICGAMGRNSVNSTCLTHNSGVKLVTTNQCGNGIVEDGEECDCGGPEGCGSNSCCDPLTCKFTAGSQCDSANEMCCVGCQFASSNTVCRASQGPCDPAEFCPGNSSACPPDALTPNGETCKVPGLSGQTCISGHCTSRDEQCVTLLGNASVTADGTLLNVTKACNDDSSCQLSCEDPRFGSTCFTTSQNFLDGTPCQSSGTCQRGVCIGGIQNNGGGSGSGSSGGGGSGGGSSPSPPQFTTPFGEGWLQTHQTVIIGIAAGVAGAILIAIVWSMLRRMRYRNRLRNAGVNFQAPPAAPAPRTRRPPPPPPPAPVYAPTYYGNSQPVYVDKPPEYLYSYYNGRSGAPPVPPRPQNAYT